MNRSIFVGRLGQDSELKYTTGGSCVLSLNVAVNVGFGDRKQTIWKRCDLWGKRAEALQPHLLKGSQVCIDAEEWQDEYTDKEGMTRKTLKYTVGEISLIGGKGNSYQTDQVEPSEQRKQPAPAARNTQEEPSIEEDVPF